LKDIQLRSFEKRRLYNRCVLEGRRWSRGVIIKMEAESWLEKRRCCRGESMMIIKKEV